MKLPRKFGRYELVERIAVGGTAEIYRAVLASTDGFRKTVAVKALLPQWTESDDLAHLLIDEAKVLCHLGHQSIVQVYELGHEDGIPFMAMEFVDGIDCARLLTRIIREKSPPPAGLVLYIMDHVLSALKLAHERKDGLGNPIGIVHRDISPSNILLSWTGEVKVTDFGIAKGSHRSRMTDAGQMRGKYAYMSPEQTRGEGIDGRSDIFSCGIVMYELLTARRLFTGKSDADVLSAVQGLSVEAMDLSPLARPLVSILLLALARDRDARYQGAGEMLADVRGAMLAQRELFSGAELSKYITDVFAEEIEAEAMENDVRREPTKITHVLPCECDGKVRTSRWRGLLDRVATGWRVAALILISFGFLTTHPADGSVEYSPPPRKGDAIVESRKFEMEAPTPPRIGGVIAIDTEPSGATGVITLGDRRIEITTPFTKSGIAVDGKMAGRLEIGMPGYRPYSETFSLSSNSSAMVREIKLKRRASSRLFVGARPWGLATIKGYASSRETPIAGIAVKAGSHLVTVSHPPSGKRISRRVSVGEGESKRCLADFRAQESMSCR